MSPRLALIGTALCVLAGCLPESPAQILLEIDTDLEAPAQFDALEVRVYGGIRADPSGRVGAGRCGPEGRVSRNGFEYILTFCHERSFRPAPALPLRVGVVPGSVGAAGERVGVEVVAYLGDVEVLRTVDHTRFPQSGSRTVEMFLAEACLATVCEPGLTCRRAGVCEEPELPEEPDGGSATDAGLAEDAGVPTDAPSPGLPDTAVPGGCVTAADCAPTSLGAWSSCSYGGECDRNGTRARTVTTHPCEGGVCGTRTTSEDGICSRETNGDPCGGGTTTDLGTCGGFTSECDEIGSQTVRTTQRACGAGSCVTEMFEGMQACARPTNGAPCDGGTTTSYTTCVGFTTECDRTGMQDSVVTERFCAAGACTSERWSRSIACFRDTTGDPCGRAPMCRDACSAAGTCVPGGGAGCAS